MLGKVADYSIDFSRDIAAPADNFDLAGQAMQEDMEAAGEAAGFQEAAPASPEVVTSPVEPPPTEPSAASEPRPVEAPPPVVEMRRPLVEMPPPLSEDEQRQHSDARRFARLLVSELKLYNEQAVVEGRRHGDIYQRLKQDIDRSREIYNRRVPAGVTRRSDYFHEEMVKLLAEGDSASLGSEYPGSRAEQK
jgi:hypothetical protein